MYDPFAPPQLPQQGQMHTMEAPQTVGMVPGVPGSMGLNPGAGGPIHGQQVPDPTMYPGGPSRNNALGGVMQSPQFQALLQAYPQLNQYFSQGGGRPMMDWRSMRPDRQGYAGGDWRGAMRDWRGQRPGMATASPAPTGMLPPQPMPPTPAPGMSTDPTSPFAGPPMMSPRPMRSGPRGGAGNGHGF